MNRIAPPPKSSHVPPPRHPYSSDDAMWPLDAWLAALSSVILYLLVTRLSFNDPRWLFNAATYAIAVPVIALGLAFLLRGVASKYMQKSIQIGFLFSVFVHLLLMILAVNVLIFSASTAEARSGVKPERSPVRKTVPEHLFQTPKEESATPDWSKPVEAETSSREVPKELRQIPPVDRTAPQLQMPKPKEVEPVPQPKFLMERQKPVQSQPNPANSPAKLARREISSEKLTAPKTSQPKAPQLDRKATEETKSKASERKLAKETPRKKSSESAVPKTNAQPVTPKMTVDNPSSSTVSIQNRKQSEAMPTIGEMGMTAQSRPRTKSQSQSLKPAGASPAPPSVAIASISENSDQMVSKADLSHSRSSATSGAQLSPMQSPDAMSAPSSEPTSASDSQIERRDASAMAGMPNVESGGSPRARPDRPSLGNRDSFTPLGAPSLPNEIASMAADHSDPASASMSDRADLGDVGTMRGESSSGIPTPMIAPDAEFGPSLDIMMKESIAGLADRPESFAGVVPSDDVPEVGDLEISNQPRKRKDVGGPVTPAGTEIAAVESFSRRVMRTEGGAAPTPAGLVGAETEEAIELGLAYLADSQNKDGSWSLAGHGEEVLLNSDSAATGLCLLAFQGAGYTHKRHQYADTVSRGLAFLLRNQRSNGDLYRSEDPLSNRNVGFYSHGIAALAVCEAYGMTQDEEIKEAAQASLDYIGKTQHAKLGGWRYAAQVSSDTSVSGWMMMALKSGELAGLETPPGVYNGIDRWLEFAQESKDRPDRYRYNPEALDTPSQRHGRVPTPTMTAVGMLMRMYSGWKREDAAMQSAADYLLESPPRMGTTSNGLRDGYYWYYATQVMFHMGGDHWTKWNRFLNPLLLESQIKEGSKAGSWDPKLPVADRWSEHGGRLYVTTMNLLNLEVYYRHLPIYEDVAE